MFQNQFYEQSVEDFNENEQTVLYLSITESLRQLKSEEEADGRKVTI